jgi:ArsR family transcriptional regulator
MKLFTKKKSVQLSKDEERLIFAMNLLGDKTRFKIFKLLMANKEMCVTDIADELNVSVSAVSQHFRNFELVGLVDKERMGQKICYMLKADDGLVKELVKVALKGSYK